MMHTSFSFVPCFTDNKTAVNDITNPDQNTSGSSLAYQKGDGSGAPILVNLKVISQKKSEIDISSHMSFFRAMMCFGLSRFTESYLTALI